MQREILTVVQPCILCEEPLAVQVIYRDDETGEETIGSEEIPHTCAPMERLLAERISNQYAKTRARARRVVE